MQDTRRIRSTDKKIDAITKAQSESMELKDKTMELKDKTIEEKRLKLALELRKF